MPGRRFASGGILWGTARQHRRRICPAGKRLRPCNRNFTSPRPEADQDGFIRYRARQQDCSSCALKPRCAPTLPARKVTRSIREGARDLARALSQEKEWIALRRERKKVEMLFAHMKRIMRLNRLRLRGPDGARDEFHLAAAAQKLRKLVKISIARQTAMT